MSMPALTKEKFNSKMEPHSTMKDTLGQPLRDTSESPSRHKSIDTSLNKDLQKDNMLLVQNEYGGGETERTEQSRKNFGYGPQKILNQLKADRL